MHITRFAASGLRAAPCAAGAGSGLLRAPQEASEPLRNAALKNEPRKELRVAVIFDDRAALEAAIGGPPLVSAPLTVTQAMIDAFAAATDDPNWIHVDRERARRESPYGATVAHGFLTLSLLVPLLRDCLTFAPSQLGLNYGFERVRFLGPVPAGSEIRGRFALTSVVPTESGTRLSWNVEVLLRDAARPVLAATWLILLVG